MNLLGSYGNSVRSRTSAVIARRVAVALPILICKVGVLLFLGFGLAATGAQTPRIERIHIVERGIYRAETVSRDQRAEQQGFINTVQNPQLINATESIIGQVGVRFGLRYIAIGVVGDARLNLLISFPPPGQRDPATGQTYFQSELTVRPTANDINYWEYHFEHDWEIVTGTWTFEFWFGGRKLAEQRFCVSPPHDLSAAVAMIGRCQPQLLHDTR
jgi:hypothetical protein